MNERPWLWLVAGPNGAGKTTYAPNLAADTQEIVRPDEIAARLSTGMAGPANVGAARIAISRTRALLQERRNFAIETTFAGRRYPQLVERAKATGWNVGIVYIGLAFQELAIERVRQRVLAGGHDVPVVDIRRRYDRGLQNLAGLCKVIDRLVVLDNSSAEDQMRRVLEAHSGKIVFARRRLPDWAQIIRNAIRPRRRKRSR